MDNKSAIPSYLPALKFLKAALPIAFEILGAAYDSSDKAGVLSSVCTRFLWISVSVVILFLRILKLRTSAKTPAWVSSELFLIYAITKAFLKSDCSTFWIMMSGLVMISQVTYYRTLVRFGIKQGVCMGIYYGFVIVKFDAYFNSDQILPFMLVFIILLYNHSKYHIRKRDYDRLKFRTSELAYQFETTINAISVGIVAINSAHKPLMYNRSMIDICQATHPYEIFTSLAGMSFRSDADNHTKWSDSLRLVDHIHHFLSIDQQNVSLGVVSHKSKAIEIRVSKISWEGTTAILITARDVTQLLELEKEKSQNNFKSCLLRTVSHELRTPTNGILGMMELVRDDTMLKLNKRNQKRLDIAIKSCKHLLLLINDLLDYSQIVAGTLAIHPVSFSLKEFLNDCLSLVEFGAKERNILLRLEIMSNVPRFITNEPNRLSQIILNLLSNSLKFTMTGEIAIIVNRLNPAKLSISVKDTGIGIPDNKLTQLFQAFGRIDDVMHNKLNPLGCGLGLHISNMLVQYLRGDPISVTSVEGKGSIFTITLPLDSDSAPTEAFDLSLNENSNITFPVSQTSFNRNPFHAQYPTVLIVDDSYFNCEVASQILQSMNISTERVVNGQQAMDYILEHLTYAKCPRIVILDYELPDMKGTEIARFIHSKVREGILKCKPVLFAVSASTTEDVLQEWRSAGVSEIIPKPCSIDTLRKKTQEHLSRFSSKSK
jgi:signal transduction histidine kinase